MTDSIFLSEQFRVQSPNVIYSENDIISKYCYQTTTVTQNAVKIVNENITFKTDCEVGKIGVMLVGWGGNNGSTVTAAIIANKLGMSWMTKEGSVDSNYYGSLTQSSTVRLGTSSSGDSVFIPFKNILPMVNPNNLVIGGWDISSLSIAESMRRAKVLDYDLQSKLMPHLESMKPLPSIYYPDFIAANQNDRADNLIHGSKQQHLEAIRQDIRNFKSSNHLDKVIVLWTANTERFSSVEIGLNDTADTLLDSIMV